MDNVLRVGDVVTWRGVWGSEEAKDAKVIGIIECYAPGEKDGIEIDSVDWESVDGRDYIIDLDNGHWSWSFQVSKKD